MSLFNKTKLGFGPLKNVKAVKIKDRVAISKMLDYQFTLPDGFVFTENSGKAYFDKDSYLEFRAEKGNTSIGVIITPMQGAELVHNWNDVCDQIQIAMMNRFFVSIEEPGIKFVDFLGYRCAHASGTIANKDKYVEEYVYSLPYCTVSFMAITDINTPAEIKYIFNHFKKK